MQEPAMLFRPLLVTLIALASLAGTPLTQAAELKGWVREAAEFPQHQGLLYFFERLKANTTGKYQGTVVCCEAMGNQPAMVPKFKKGEVDIALFFVGPLADAVPEVGVLGLPFLFRSPEHMMQALEGDVGKELQQMLAPKGFIVLAWYDGGSRSFYSRNRLLQYTSDFKDQKIRVPNREELVRTTKALGGITSNLAFDKLPDAFKSSELDIAENDLTSYYTSEHYKVAPFYTFSHHVVQPIALLVSTQLWSKLDDTEKAAFRKAATESAVQARKIRAERDAEIKARLQKLGVKFGEFKSAATVIAALKDAYAPILVNQRATDLMLRVMATPSK